MNWFFAPAIRLFSGTKVAANLYWIGVLALLPLLILVALILGNETDWLTPSLRASAMTIAVLCLFLEAYAMGALFMRIGPDVGKVAGAIKRIGSGDLTARIDHPETYEGGKLGEYVRQTNENLIAIVAQVRASSDAIVGGAKEIASGNQLLSQRTESQAATLEQTASSMEELAASAKQNAESCRRANEFGTRAGSIALASAEQVKELTQSMGAIVTSSKQIEDIVSVIEGIAFQTNILALNAAVEAARAGEQGRGFAVVASEVRHLAQRSSVAAKEIKSLIHASVEHVNGGTRLVGKVATTIQDVVSSVREVNGLITDIADASGEQSLSVDEVNRGIFQLEQVSQQNATLVHQASQVAMGFEGESRRLSDVVDKFKLDRMAAREQAVALVESAVLHLKAKGRERAYQDFEKPNSAFMFADYYVYVLDFNANVFVHPTLKGKNAIDLADSDGKKFVQPMIATAKSSGKGWEDYRWINPTTNQSEQKSAYFQRVDDLIIACGIYKGEVHQPAPARLRLVAQR